MTLSLHTIGSTPGSRQRRRRVGRGNGSRGTYSGRGAKGQRSRTGGTRGIIRRSLRSLMERVAKQRGFTSRSPKFSVVNLLQLEQRFRANDVVSPETLHSKGLVESLTPVKLLGQGKLSKALTVRVHAVSATARKAVEQGGGKVTILGLRVSGQAPDSSKEA